MALVTTDRTHTPNGVILPFHRHHRQAEMVTLQAALSVPLKKRLWQAIVQRKIANQAALIEACGADARSLRAMVGLVGSGDADNVEARAARAYWSQLFAGFVREDASDKRNMLLNYGYAVIRSYLARALVAVGLVPALGINHASVTNAFNLADDLVEPFRPFVDRLVWGLTGRGHIRDGEPGVGERRALASVLLEEAKVGGETVSLLVASEKAAESLVRAMQARSPALLMLPRLGDG
jgi:CRISPR-associated protein Cas1